MQKASLELSEKSMFACVLYFEYESSRSAHLLKVPITWVRLIWQLESDGHLSLNLLKSIIDLFIHR